MRTVLTGITTTGVPHLGNYVGAIKPAIESSRRSDVQSYYFLADYHALIKCDAAEAIYQSTREIACAWLALGLDPDRVTFYRQSDIPEVPELAWILSCVTAKGLMNRAHAYKAAVQQNEAGQMDPDHAVTMGLFGYPVLMSADILLFNAHDIPVGRDQIQHVEMARDIAQRFNHLYAELFTLPTAVVNDNTAVLQGLDGRKMSKSYNNTIPLFVPSQQLLKCIRKIKTNSQPPGEPKDPQTSALFHIWQAFADAAQTDDMRRQFAAGIAWGDVKNHLFELIDAEISTARERYAALMCEPHEVEKILVMGAEKARAHSRRLLSEIRAAVGIRPLTAAAPRNGSGPSR